MHVSRMRVRTALGAAVMSLLVVGVRGQAQAADRFVSTAGSDAANDCLGSANPCRTVAQGLAQAASGDTVKVAEGSYAENLTVNTATALTLSGGWADDFATRDADAMPTRLKAAMQLPVLTVRANGVAITLTIDGLTIERGQNPCSSTILIPNCFGGGVSAQATAGGALGLALNHILFQHNRGGFGAGLGARVGDVGSSLSVAVTDSTVLANIGNVGAGMAIQADDADASLDVSFDHVLFKRNRAVPLDGSFGVAGGLFFAEGASGPHQFLVQNSTFDRNGGQGIDWSVSGGCVMGSCQLNVVNSVFVHNRAAISVEGGGAAELVNVTATKNRATRVGGVLIEGGTIRNSILWGNRASYGYPQDLFVPFGNVGLDHSDIRDQGVDPGGSVTDLGGNINADPLFVSARDIHLTTGSPAIDTGTCTGAPTTDIDGDPRPTGASCDMGADEFVP